MQTKCIRVITSLIRPEVPNIIFDKMDKKIFIFYQFDYNLSSRWWTSMYLRTSPPLPTYIQAVLLNEREKRHAHILCVCVYHAWVKVVVGIESDVVSCPSSGFHVVGHGMILEVLREFLPNVLRFTPLQTQQLHHIFFHLRFLWT